MNMMILFEYVPDGFGLGIMVPIPKVQLGKGNVCTDEFRRISINPIISKLFEYCLLTVFSSYLHRFFLKDFWVAEAGRSSCWEALALLPGSPSPDGAVRLTRLLTF